MTTRYIARVQEHITTDPFVQALYYAYGRQDADPTNDSALLPAHEFAALWAEYRTRRLQVDEPRAYISVRKAWEAFTVGRYIDMQDGELELLHGSSRKAEYTPEGRLTVTHPDGLETDLGYHDADGGTWVAEIDQKLNRAGFKRIGEWEGGCATVVQS